MVEELSLCVEVSFFADVAGQFYKIRVSALTYRLRRRLGRGRGFALALAVARKDFTKCRRSDSPAFSHLDVQPPSQSSCNLPSRTELACPTLHLRSLLRARRAERP